MRTLAAAIIAAVLLTGASAHSSRRPAVHHYYRGDIILPCTRTKGCWEFHCHDVKHPQPNLWLPGGCLPPKRVN